MTKEYRYTLEKGNKKHGCPDCGKKTFVRYIDTNTGNHLPDHYGRCDRESKCNYHLNPYKDGYSKMITEQERGENSGNWKPQRPIAQPKPAPKPEPVFIPFDVFAQTRQGYEQNVFIQNLLSRVPFPFDAKDVERVISQYHLGTVCSGYRAGAITFPYIDKSGNVRAIQVKQFDQTNHTTGTDFLHSIIEKHYQRKNEALPDWLEPYNNNEIKVSCLFGERCLSKYPLNPIALVEAPKTAVYGTLYFGFPEQPKNLLWLAVYNLSSLNPEKCKALQGRDVVLFPDLSKDGKAFQDWSNKAKQFSELMPGTQFKVSDWLETLAPNELKEDGADIADVLIKMDWRKFRNEKIEPVQLIEQPTPEPILTPKGEKGENSEALKKPFFSQQLKPVAAPEPDLLAKVSIQQNKQPESWDPEILELETYFTQIQLQKQPVKLNSYSTITNVPLFIETHFATVKANNGKRTFLPFLNRLQELKQYFTQNIN